MGGNGKEPQKLEMKFESFYSYLIRECTGEGTALPTREEVKARLRGRYNFLDLDLAKDTENEFGPISP